ncbi:MAG TPA: sigma-70 family RNA polymerase sigma factor [Planctomycetota bacterium]|nr:sigma-70 family RNA polymerase sigma factor [Planctomycetota bacterium]
MDSKGDPEHGLDEALHGAESRASSEFERLYAGAVPALIAWARLRMSSLPSGRIDVEDIVQETWVRALENFGRFRDRESFRHWVIGIAQNVLLEALRRDVRQRRDPLRNQAGSNLSQCPDTVTSISRAAARDDGFLRLLGLILELPTDDRQLLLLHGLEERPLANVARQLEISEEAAGKRWQRLRARLQEQPAFLAVLTA